MSGKLIAIFLFGFALVFGAALWWFQTEAYYEEQPSVDRIVAGGADLPVTGYRAIDAATSPLKLRACFRIAEGVAQDALDQLPGDPEATPLVAPAWFDCFDAPALTEDLAAGRIRAAIAASNEIYGFDRILATAPDGRGWMWRQLNRCGEAVFDGKDAPAGCPPPPAR